MADRYHRDYQKEKIPQKTYDSVLIKRMASYLKPFRPWVLLAVIFLLISRGIDAVIPILLGKMTQGIFEQQIIFQDILKTISTIIGFLITAYLLDVTNEWIKSTVGHRALYTLRMQVFDHIQRLPIGFFDHQPVGRLMTRTIHDVDQLRQLFSESIIPLIGSLFMFFTILLLMFYINWQLALTLVAALPIVAFLTNHFREEQRRCYELIRSIVSVLNTFIQEHILGASTIRNFGLQKKEKKLFEEINEDHCQSYIEAIRNFSFFVAGIDFTQSFLLIAVFIVLVLINPAGEPFQVGTYLTFSLYVTMSFRPLADLADRYNILQSANAAAERIFNILDQPLENKGGKLELEDIHHIAFENVWFAYEAERWILKGISFEMKKGESVAIVGITGEGKTTILQLLLCFYDYQRGAIKINGRDIHEYSRASIRNCIGFVSQDAVLFSGSLFDNIALYDPKISKEQVVHALQEVHLDWPLDYLLEERGKSISAGQMQQVAIARALVHNRSMIILDEATANIDIGTEKAIQSALKKLIAHKSALIVAHRLSTVRHMHKILVINGGILVEEGSHEALLAKKGIYEKLYRLHEV